MTLGTDIAVGGEYDQFLEVLPSEQSEGGLEIHFSGTEAASGDSFDNPVNAFGFYLMGRETKRDVYLDVYNTEGSLIFSQAEIELFVTTFRYLCDAGGAVIFVIFLSIDTDQFVHFRFAALVDAVVEPHRSAPTFENVDWAAGVSVLESDR